MAIDPNSITMSMFKSSVLTGRVLSVGTDGLFAYDYNHPQTAYNAANNNDVILIYPGTYSTINSYCALYLNRGINIYIRGMGEYVDADGGLIGGMSRDSMADKFNSMMSSGFKDIQDEDTRSELLRRTAGQKKMTTEQVEQLMAKFGQFQGTAYSGDISNELLGGKSAQEMLNYLEMNNKVLSEIADRLKVQK